MKLEDTVTQLKDQLTATSTVKPDASKFSALTVYSCLYDFFYDLSIQAYNTYFIS